MKTTLLAAAMILAAIGTNPASAEVYVGGSIGNASADVPSLDSLCWTGCSTSQNDTSASLKVFLGARVTPNFAVEGFFTTINGFSSHLADDLGPIDVDIDLTALGVSGVGILPVSPSFDVFGKFGMFRYSETDKWTGTLEGQSFAFTVKESGTEMLFGAGANIKTKAGPTLRVEMERYDTETPIDVFSVGALFNF